MALLTPLTTPAVKVLLYPRGLPIAYTDCPVRKSADVPTCTGRNLCSGASTNRTAMSCWASVPTSDAGYSIVSPLDDSIPTLVTWPYDCSHTSHHDKPAGSSFRGVSSHLRTSLVGGKLSNTVIVGDNMPICVPNESASCTF